ncbi:calmodulin-4-like isoform X1 [Cimex lectularius]|uniref:EF-hand domain-containing protein n=1 Tax=Cimex lectularius TaxID=79782 RepID=A0A8I6RPV5_CIMLE|nr:calmodulin-4-like isoform X1 [Cimex lectularius]
MSRKVCGRLTAAEKIRQMYLKNTSAKTPHLSNHEIAETRKLFTYFDRNKDSHLDQKEYSDLIAYETSNRLSENGLKTVFASSDYNSDGLISEDEFLAYRGRLRKWQPSMFEISNLFYACDKNEDRKMSFEEFKVFWRELGEDTSRMDLKKIFSRFDRNKDNNITKDELLRLVSENLKRPFSQRKFRNIHLEFLE